jgi:hypothetical protein
MSEPDQQRAAADAAAHTERERLSAEVDVLLGRVSRWNAAGWGEPAGGGTRADVVFALVQRLADVAADAEGRPRRDVPRLDTGVLPDQLVVMAHDVLVTGSAAACRAALDAVARARADLFGPR